MKNINKWLYLVFIVFLLAPSLGFNQNSEEIDSLNTKLMNAAREIMTSSKTCALITLDHEGRPRARTMDPFLPESDFTIWFGTNPKSRKVNQIKNNPKVTLYYLENNSSGYVVIHGTATIVNDQSEKDKWWKTEWDAFYPNNTDDYQLIKVSPQRMEVISYTHSIIGDPATWEVPVVIFEEN